MAKNRMALAPDIPSVDEAGAPGLLRVRMVGPVGAEGDPREKSSPSSMSPSSTPPAAEPAVRTQLAKLGLEVPPREQQSPEVLGTFQKAEIDKWWPIIKETGIKPE